MSEESAVTQIQAEEGPEQQQVEELESAQQSIVEVAEENTGIEGYTQVQPEVDSILSRCA